MINTRKELTKQYQISNHDFWNKIESDFGKSGGVYKLYCIDKGKPIKIDRVLKTDYTGILYIGKAASFLDRVITLKKSLSPIYISSNHECGVRYKNSEPLKKKFPFEKLWVELIGCEDINKEEKKLLSTYEKQYGELPPLNRNE